MHRRRLLALTAALAGGGLAGCVEGDDDPGGSTSPTETMVDPDLEEGTLSELIASTNALAVDLYGESMADSGENLLASPVSVTTALAMTYAGARDETRGQMREALNYTLEDDVLHDAFAALQGKLKDRGGEVDEEDLPSNYDPEDDPVPFELTLVNALWGQAEFPFREAYLSLVESHYDGGLREVDYETDPEAARGEINNWVADRTEDRITDLLPEGSIKERTRLVLTNAIYFLANWNQPFQADRTEQKPFTALDGSSADVPMMSQEASFPYAEVDGVQAIDLPYVGEDVSMLLVLPPEGEFASFESALDRQTLSDIVDALETREGTLSIPRFEFDSGFTLKGALEALGMPIAFEEQRADFSGMAHLEQTGGNLYISDVYHKTYVAVDEEGTEAAAATGVVVDFESAPADPFEFVADRPFLFAIRDRPTGTILFLGRVVDAGAAQ